MLNLFIILAWLTYPIKWKIAWMSQRNPIPLSSVSILFFFHFPILLCHYRPHPYPSSFMSCHSHLMCLAVIALLCMWRCQTPMAWKQNWDNGIITVCTCINWGGKNKAESNVRGKKRIRFKKSAPMLQRGRLLHPETNWLQTMSVRVHFAPSLF